MTNAAHKSTYTATADIQPPLNEHAAARAIGVSVVTLRRMRRRGTGPEFLKIGALIRYSRQAIIDYLDSCRVGGGRAA